MKRGERIMTVQVFRKDTKELRTTLHNVLKIEENSIEEMCVLNKNGVYMNLGKDHYILKVVSE